MITYRTCTVVLNTAHMAQRLAYGHPNRVLRRLYCEGESCCTDVSICCADLALLFHIELDATDALCPALCRM